MPAIRILSSHVADKIAAGEVVERPASVVKELVENSLDADARSITIEIAEGGKRLIRIADDGHGIPSEQVALAFQRHATSKLTDIEDLNHIATLGFRGEALSSIASVSRMSITTRTADEQAGSFYMLEGGEVIREEWVGAPRGTIIDVENLFFNVPARLKFLGKDTTERKHITALVQRYAMAYPHIRFTLVHNNSEILRTTGSGELLDVITEVYGLDTAQQMLSVHLENQSARPDLHPVTVTGYVSQPALNRGNRTQMTIFINGRWVQDTGLNYAVSQAYHTMLMQGRHPVAILMVEVPPEQVDVNVHPAKAQVRFRQQNVVFSAVQRAVRSVLVEQAQPPSLRNDVLWSSPEWAARRDRLTQVTTDRMRQLNFEDSQTHYKESYDEADQVQPRPRKNALPMLRVVGQVGATYVVAEGPEGLYLVDQHAAHERILYEQFMKEMETQEIPSQELLETLAIELAPDQMALIEENLDLLNAVGFGVELFGRGTVRLRAVPALVANTDPGSALLAAIGEIECGDMPTQATAEQKLISRVCKQASVKAGQSLSLEEMRALVRQLEACESPRTCPHGRPTMLHLSAERLAKEFGRLGAI